MTVNFENMYVQGKYDGKVYVGCGPKNLSPKIQLNMLMISKTLDRNCECNFQKFICT